MARVPPCHGGRCGFESHCSLQMISIEPRFRGFSYLRILIPRSQFLLFWRGRIVAVVPTHWKGCIPQGKGFDLLASPPIPSFSHLERSHSGLVHTLGKGAYRKIPGVRISLSPPEYQIAILPLQPQVVLDPPVLYQDFNIMMNIISKLAQKPTDKSIRITRIVFALIILATILFGWGVTRTEF